MLIGEKKKVREKELNIALTKFIYCYANNINKGGSF